MYIDNLVSRVENDKARLSIFYDINPSDPREWDNLGTMVCWHRRYILGDKHNFENTRDMIECLADELYDRDYIIKLVTEKIEENVDIDGNINDNYPYILNGDSYSDYKDLLYDIENYPFYYLSDDELWDLLEDKVIILPLYLYDHSGITINTTGFFCPWDSGQVGWIYCTKDRFRKETGYTEDELFSTDKHRIPKIGERVKVAGYREWGQVKKIDENKVTVDFDYNRSSKFKEAKNVIEVPLNYIAEVVANRAEQILINEVKIYDQFIRGDVYGYKLEKKEICECCNSVEYEEIDSCWGFYGDDFKEHMKEYIPDEYHELLDLIN